MKKLILTAMIGLLCASLLSAGVIRFTGKESVKAVKSGANLGKKTAKFVFKVAY